MLELGVVEVCVESALLNKLLVRAFFDDVALVHDENYVGVLDCREAVSDDEGSFVLHELFKSLLNFEFGAGID